MPKVHGQGGNKGRRVRESREKARRQEAELLKRQKAKEAFDRKVELINEAAEQKKGSIIESADKMMQRINEEFLRGIRNPKLKTMTYATYLIRQIAIMDWASGKMLEIKIVDETGKLRNYKPDEVGIREEFLKKVFAKLQDKGYTMEDIESQVAKWRERIGKPGYI